MPDRAELIRLLTGYSPTDSEEVESRIAMLDLAAVADDPFDRHDYTPGHITSSGFVLSPTGNEVLLVHHARLDLWLQPGGHVESSDGRLLDAARREVAEETGITDLVEVSDGILDLDIHPFPETSDQEAHHHYDIRFGFVTRSIDLEGNHEVHDVRWASRDDLGGLGVDRSVTRPVAKLLGDSLAP